MQDSFHIKIELLGRKQGKKVIGFCESGNFSRQRFWYVNLFLPPDNKENNYSQREYFQTCIFGMIALKNSLLHWVLVVREANYFHQEYVG